MGKEVIEYKRFGLAVPIVKGEFWEMKPIIERTWKERLFTHPWTPFQKYRIGRSDKEFNDLMTKAFDRSMERALYKLLEKPFLE